MASREAKTRGHRRERRKAKGSGYSRQAKTRMNSGVATHGGGSGNGFRWRPGPGASKDTKVLYKARQWHQKAITFSDRADEIARLYIGSPEEREVRLKALKYEKRAAFLLKDLVHLEPSRSALFRSAASMARQLGNYQEAAHLAGIALWGNPPTEFRDELEVLEVSEESEEGED